MSVSTHVTLAEYDRMIAEGIFNRHGRERLELIRGEILEMAPIGSLHEVIVDRLTEWSYENLPRGKVWVRVQNSVGLPELESAPEPDLAWVARRDYSKSRPRSADVLLIIEVAESSLPYDRGAKANLYAEAGIKEYWIFNLVDTLVEVRRNPDAGKYQSLQQFSGEAEFHPLAFPDLTIKPSCIWPTGG
jgi:Uma2 family endonuclease